MERDESTASSIINLASVFAQGSTLAGAACASAFDSEVPAGARGRTSGAVADEQVESRWPHWVWRWREKEASLFWSLLSSSPTAEPAEGAIPRSTQSGVKKKKK